MDMDVSYAVLVDFVVGEIKAILRVVKPDSLCFYLLTDTLKHIDTLEDVINEDLAEERKREAETSPIPQ